MKAEQNVNLIDFEDQITQITHRSESLSKVNGNRGILMSLVTLKAIINYVITKLKNIDNKLQNVFEEIKEAEILQPYVQKEVPEPVVQPITEETPLIHERYNSNPFVAVANSIIEKEKENYNASMASENSIITPVSQEIPKIEETPQVSSQIETIGVRDEVSQPQIMPVYNQPLNEATMVNNSQVNSLSQDEEIKSSIDTELYQGQSRREVVEQPVLQTPQEFQAPMFEQKQDPFANVDIKLEGMRAEINNDHNEFRQYFDMKFRNLIEEFNKKSGELSQRDNSKIDEMSREIERARTDNKESLKQIQSTQQEIINEYNGGIYNAR